jgi:GNAT superfamily N-acetyltransferase
MNETSVIEITKKIARNLIIKFHYLGTKSFRFEVGYGLRLKDDFIGAIVFHGPSAPETVVGAFGLDRKQQNGIWEIGRLVLDPNYNGKNYGSYFISKAIKMLRKKRFVRAIITYAESNRHYGAVYQASNFKFCGLTAKKKDFFPNAEMQQQKNLFFFDDKIQERGKTKNREGIWIDRPQKYRYVMLFDKTLQLKWNQIPYVKKIFLEKGEMNGK